MALNVKSDRADRLARQLAATTGESLTDAITVALEERLARERARRLRARTLSPLLDEIHALPVLDTQAVDDIVEYDELGLPR